MARSAVAAGSAGDLIDRINNYVMGHLVMDDLTAIVKALVLGALGLPLCWAFAAAVSALPGAEKVL